MEKEMFSFFINVIHFLVVLFAFSCIFYLMVKMFRLFSKCKHTISQNSVELLHELQQSVEPEAKAKIFISLISIRYVLIHKMINAGIKYDDDKQRIRFEKFLTEATINKLNIIGENIQ